MIGPVEMVLITILGVVGFAFPALVIWSIVDAATRPEQAWGAAGQNKALWVALLAVGLVLFAIPGFVIAVGYLTAIRPKLRAVPA